VATLAGSGQAVWGDGYRTLASFVNPKGMVVDTRGGSSAGAGAGAGASPAAAGRDVQDQDAYFQLTDRVRRKVTIPAAYAHPRPVAASQVDNVRQAFLQANPRMPQDGIRTKSVNRMLEEVRICMTKAGDFRSCN
jgi:hypothetical protein